MGRRPDRVTDERRDSAITPLSDDELASIADLANDEPGRRLLTAHATLLDRWRRAMNLVGPGPLLPHYQDGALGLAGLVPTGRWVDLGTGAGFPGIVFAAVFGGVALELVDSRSKRCRFIDEVLAEAGPDGVTVRCMRHEDLPAGVFDGVMSRALASPGEMVEVASRLLVPGGTLVLFLQEEAEVPTSPGWDVFHVEHYAVDGRPRKTARLRRAS